MDRAPGQMHTRSTRSPTKLGKDMTMLFALALVFVVLWGMGFLAFHVTTGFIHLLLIAAVVAVIYQLVTRQTA
jgi:hypothetical protein